MTDLEQKWEEAREILQTDLNEASFSTWIAPLHPIKIDPENRSLQLQLPKDKPAKFMERYIPAIEQAVFHVFREDYKVSLIPEKEEISAAGEGDSEEYKNSFYLNPRYTFNTFVIGGNNSFAHAAALGVAEAPSCTYNPLFLYGGSGLGKTHLMHAIGNHIKDNHPNMKVRYISSELFTNELITAIRTGKTIEFKKRYRDIDVLLIDDIQFIEQKESTQEEFFHTFNTLYAANKQIIISSDRPPKDLSTLDDRLRSRFESGLLADIQPPEFETRVAILQKKADLEGIPRTPELEEAFVMIANKVRTNIRELEGSLNSVVAITKYTGESITPDLVQKILKDRVSSNETPITADRIKEAVNRKFALKKGELESSKRPKNLAYARQIAMYLCRELTDLSLPKIAESFGGRDHTTVLYAWTKISNDLKAGDPSLQEIISAVEDLLQE